MPRPRFAERHLAVLHEVRRAARRRRGARPASSRGAGRSRAPGAASGVTSSTGSPCSRDLRRGPVVVDLAQRALVDQRARHRAEVGQAAVQHLVRDVAGGGDDLIGLRDQIHAAKVTRSAAIRRVHRAGVGIDTDRSGPRTRHWPMKVDPGRRRRRRPALGAVAAHDLTQKRHAILRNFPVIGHLRYLLEAIGPELRQYIVTAQRRGAAVQPRPAPLGLRLGEAGEQLLRLRHRQRRRARRRATRSSSTARSRRRRAARAGTRGDEVAAAVAPRCSAAPRGRAHAFRPGVGRQHLRR